MPIKFTLRFRLKPNPKYKDKTDFLITPDVLHGFFFSLLPEKLAEELHQKTQYQPFAIWAPQIFNKTKFLKKENSNSEKTYNFNLTISFLKEELFSPFLLGLFENSKSYYLGPFIAELVLLPGSVILRDQYCNYDDFLQTSSKPYLYFKFITPTVLKKNGKDLAQPEVSTIFKSLIQKWKTFSPYRISVNLKKALESGIKIIHNEIRQQKILFSFGNKILTFRGEVIFSCEGASEEELRWLCALSAFSEFAGVGRKTTMGLGMVSFKAMDSPEEVLSHGESPNFTNRSL